MIKNKISVAEFKKETGKSYLELEFLLQIKMLKLPIPSTEFKFDEKRKWKFDFAYIYSKIAIELEGGTRKNGRHNRPEGYAKDCEKYNQAQFLGWQVYRFVNAQEAAFFVEKLVENKMICFKILD